MISRKKRRRNSWGPMFSPPKRTWEVFRPDGRKVGEIELPGQHDEDDIQGALEAAKLLDRLGDVITVDWLGQGDDEVIEVAEDWTQPGDQPDYELLYRLKPKRGTNPVAYAQGKMKPGISARGITVGPRRGHGTVEATMLGGVYTVPHSVEVESLSITDRRKQNPWGPLFQQPDDSVPLWFWNVRDRQDLMVYGVYLDDIPTHDEVLTTMIVSGNIRGLPISEVRRRYGVIYEDSNPYTRIKIVSNWSGHVLWRLRRVQRAGVRRPNPWGPLFQPGVPGSGQRWVKHRDYDAACGKWFNGVVRQIPNYREWKLTVYDNANVVFTGYYASEEAARAAFEWMDEHRTRQPNPLGPIFAQGSSRPDEELYRWNVHSPDDSWTHVFLPKYPTPAEIADAIGRDPKDVIHFYRPAGDQRLVEFSDLSFYELNRVW